MNLKPNKILLVIFLFLLLSAVSCSIRENRTPCPCWLDIFLEDAADYNSPVILSGWRDGKCIYQATISEDECLAMGSYEAKVYPTGLINSSAIAKVSKSRLKSGNIIIPEGEQCDEYFAHCTIDLDCSGEEAEDHIRMRKQYSKLFIQVGNVPESVNNIAIEIKGNVNGMTLDGLEPIEGRFRYIATQDQNGNWCACLPRQMDNSLSMDVFTDGEHYAKVGLGDIIAQTGFCWSDADLDDIFIKINLLADFSIELNIIDWDCQTYTYKI